MNLRRKAARFFRDPRSHACFWGAGIFGLLSFLFFFTNTINNNDMAVDNPFGYGTSLSSGRWLLYLLGEFWQSVWGNYTIPLFNGLVALCLLAVTCAVLVRVLDLKSPKRCFCLSAVTVTTPAITGTMFYAFTVHYYMLALLLLTLGAYLVTHEGALPFVGCVGLTALSLGIYQAYFPVLAVLLLLRLVLLSLRDEIGPKKLFLTAVKFFLALLLSYGLYYGILRVVLRCCHTSLSDYQGINQMGLHVSLSLIKDAYLSFFLLPTRNFVFFNGTGFARAVILLCFVFSAVYCVPALFGARKKAPLLALFLLLLPLASNAMLLLVPDGTIYTRMLLGLNSVFYLPLMLSEHVALPKLRAAASGLVVLLLLSLSLNYAWQANGNYLRSFYSNKIGAHYFNTMFTRIQSLPGYQSKMKVVLVGDVIIDGSLHDRWRDTPFSYSGISYVNDVINQYSRSDFISLHLGRGATQITQEERARYADVIAEMACYPNDGSLRIVDNLVLVRLE